MTDSNTILSLALHQGKKGEIIMKKKIIGIIAVVALVAISIVSLVGCGPKLTDWEYIEDRGKFIVGYTDYAPLANVTADDKVVDGFDVDLAKAVGAELGLDVEFQLIGDWGKKTVDLEGFSIDMIWNGMTITDELVDAINISDPYLKNRQAVVVKKEFAGWVAADLVGKEIGVESGSAGEAVANERFATSTIIGAGSQVSVFTELASGTVQAGIVDSLLAATMLTGSYKDSLVVAKGFDFPEELFGIGFRKGDDVFMEKVWDVLLGFKEDGSLLTIATKYGVEDLLMI